MASFSSWKYLHLIYKVLQIDVNARQSLTTVALPAMLLQLEVGPRRVPGMEAAWTLDPELCFQGPNQNSGPWHSWNAEISGAGSKFYSQDPFPIISTVVFKYQWKSWMFEHLQLDTHEYPSRWSGAPREQIIKNKENRLHANAKLNVPTQNV